VYIQTNAENLQIQKIFGTEKNSCSIYEIPSASVLEGILLFLHFNKIFKF